MAGHPDVAIITACFGGYDKPPKQQAEQDLDVDWIAYTDGDDFPEPWQTVHVSRNEYRTARMDAKRFKCFAPDLVMAERTIWIDANTEIISSGFARGALGCTHDGIALFAHPQRHCIFSEADASLRLAPKKYEHTPIRDQVASYLAEGHPRNGGLWACGTIARERGAQMTRLGMAWWRECVRWTYQDQLSFPVVCRRLGIEPGAFPYPQIGEVGHFGSPWQIIHPHLSDA